MLFIYLLLLLCPFADTGSLFDLKMERKYDFNIDCSLHWSSLPDLNEITLMIDVPINENGWVGFGISEFGSMYGLDACVFSQGNMVDYWIPHTPTSDLDIFKDYMQHCELLQYETKDDRFRVMFKRKMKTCDAEDLDVVLFRQHVHCAYGQEDLK